MIVESRTFDSFAINSLQYLSVYFPAIIIIDRF